MVTKNVGIDLGYGFVKATDGDKEYVFPSVVGSGHDLKYRSELSKLGQNQGLDSLVITMEGRKYFVGDLAVRQSEIASRSLDQNRAEDKNTRILLYATLALFSQWEQQSFNIVTGLPTVYYSSYRDTWVSALQGSQTVRFSNGQEERERTITIEKVRVVPQPFGTLYDRVLNNIGNVVDTDLTRLTVGVVDVGFKTSDFAVSDGLEYIERLSSSTTTGLSSAYGLIAERLREEFRINKENYELDEIVSRGQIRIAGKPYDISHIKREAFERVATKIITELESLWDYRSMDVILLTGGGGQALSEFLLPRFNNAFLVEGAQAANVRGYLKLANNIFRNE